MQVEQWAPMTFDEASMERSKGFVRALQELKNLRPQLYSAAEYCEKSYLHNEQKQMVLDNLKDYAVRALVNAVDHLGTVAYKLTDLYEQQSADVSNVEIRISCLNQQMHMCQSYADKEGLRQQQLLATTPRHHKHYILPDSINQKVRTGLPLNDGAGQSKITSNLRPNSQGTPATKSLSWHLASESNSGPMKTTNTVSINGSSKSYKTAPEDFHLLDAVEPKPPLPLSSQLQSRGATSPHAASNSTIYKDFLEVPKSLPELKPFEKPTGREICRPVARNKSIISAFFAKNKYPKQKKAFV